MKKALVRLVLLSICMLALFGATFVSSASAREWYCTVNWNQYCVGPYNTWNGHYVANLGQSLVYCGSYQPNGTRQGWAEILGGDHAYISAWLYNHLICYNEGGGTTTLDIIDY